MLNCSRQSGKSTVTAALAPHTALYDPGLILLVSPSSDNPRSYSPRSSSFLKGLQPAEILEEDNKSTCELANGARIASLPGDPNTVRGFSAPRLIIKDEAGYVSDAMQAALDPMLAVSQNWDHGESIERIKIIGRQCPRISAEFLEQPRKKLGPMLFAQEFEGEFIDAESSAFSTEMIAAALVDDFEVFA